MESCDTMLCGYSYDKLFKENTYFAISNVEKNIIKRPTEVNPTRTFMSRG
ncbi:hypothetical protein [Flagellimonas eckloniae]|nr:hypothetical protein [Allomuricauda eckloniae]